MKEVQCSYTLLRSFKVEDNTTFDEINELIDNDLYELGIYDKVNDIEWNMEDN